MELDERHWLHSTFGIDEQRHIRDVFQPMGLSNDADRMLVGESFEVAYNLGALVGWFDNPRDRSEYAVPMLKHLVELVRTLDPAQCRDIEALHFTYQSIMEHAYKLREDPAWLEVTVWAAEAQATIAPKTATAMRKAYPSSGLPRHVGFERLAILADKRGDDPEVARLSELAMKQGWNGDWQRRIDKARRRSDLA